MADRAEPDGAQCRHRRGEQRRQAVGGPVAGAGGGRRSSGGGGGSLGAGAVGLALAAQYTVLLPSQEHGMLHPTIITSPATPPSSSPRRHPCPWACAHRHG